ncbi:hypothetical protein K378_01525 [Streptomyces sp. Amel2xB2]|uniref:hypothetical protein n=1 Tax=Streptomyces TaxID=1883 RepID=UPI000DBFBB37|nr:MULTISPECIES: hypothetical protein [Streptomyces]RAJ70360.1 hypothetical protein K378_01525 [Streptomyces sp. Amel2xB2]
MPESETANETRDSRAANGSGKHRGQAAGTEDPRQDARGRHRRPEGRSEPG